ncbi:hypothetical protein [Corynebacterium mayonis]
MAKKMTGKFGKGALGAAAAVLGGVAIHDLTQTKHPILRMYPVRRAL